jgi:tRNA nucleotidyltransferase (CCA-adding enzyme)
VNELHATEARGLRSADEVLGALHGLPGGRELLALARERGDVALVGGAVRDLLLGLRPRELDVTVASGSQELAAELVRVLPGAIEAPAEHPSHADLAEAIVYERFGTACVQWADGRIDVAELRAESYPKPGALPEVRPGSVEEDLARRDFTVNAISLALGGDADGSLRAADDALQDLAAGRMRILHERSFSDDPTRLLRLARYGARLRFATEEHTAKLAREALNEGALSSVSGVRVGAELMLALGEDDPPRAIAALDDLGVLPRIGLSGPLDVPLAREALLALPADGDPMAVQMAVLLGPGHHSGTDARRAARELLDSFALPAGARDSALAGAFAAPELASGLQAAARPSQLRTLLADQPVEAVAVAAALAARSSREAHERGERWLGELRHVRLEITGTDLIAAGVPEGPEIGARLTRALELKLDGELRDGSEHELRAALEARL